MSQNKSLIYGGIAALLLIAGVLFVGARNTTDPFNNSDQIVVGATIFPLTDITRQIGGERVNAITIVPPGASPHSYSITPQQIADLGSAMVIFKIGHSLDDSIAEAIARTHNIELFSVDDKIALREFGEHGHGHSHDDHDDHEHAENHDNNDHHDLHNDHGHENDDNDHHDHGHNHEPGSVDPHYWLDVHNAEKIAQNIADYLKQIDPDYADQYESNLNAYLEQLEELDAELKAMAEGVTQKHFIAMHDAWEYFADRYGFEMVATYEPVEGRQPSVADLNELKKTIEEYDIVVFYAEPQKASTAATRLLEQDFGLTISVLDPVGGFEDNDSYIDLMRRNMQALTDFN